MVMLGQAFVLVEKFVKIGIGKYMYEKPFPIIKTESILFFF